MIVIMAEIVSCCNDFGGFGYQTLTKKRSYLIQSGNPTHNVGANTELESGENELKWITKG